MAQGVSFAMSPAQSREQRLLVLIELKGGNDGLNTVVPYADQAYYALRPRIAIKRDDVVQLSDAVGLHPALAKLQPLWLAGELAVLQAVGYPAPNLSHFRSIEIWDTASASDQYLHEGWLARAFAEAPLPASFAADGVIVGSNELGPLAGRGPRAIALSDAESFVRRARLANAVSTPSKNAALAHLAKVEGDIRNAAVKVAGRQLLATTFPAGDFGNALRTACEVIAHPAGVGAVRVTLDGFDTHANQPPVQARLLDQLASGLVALRSALQELGRYDETLVLTYAEFGRRPRENQSQGTDHGTANVHFAIGGRVKGGLFGATPSLTGVNDGNIPHAIDFRSVYASVLEQWWDLDSRSTLGGRYETLPIIRG
ncbi:MAG TPA: DUF1501 domain-containing protein [Casimicrobiaceae bacterium]|nr:DUF1501 domain-containing protein [Casimicrobiaceae bacterium]